MTLAVVYFLSSCEPSGEEIDIDVKLLEIETILISGGYELEEQKYAEILRFYNEEVYGKFLLDYSFHSLQYGYVNRDERELTLICFSEVYMAQTYAEKLREEDGYEGRLVYRESEIVIITYSEETIDLFD